MNKQTKVFDQNHKQIKANVEIVRRSKYGFCEAVIIQGIEYTPYYKQGTRASDGMTTECYASIEDSADRLWIDVEDKRIDLD